MKIMQMKVIFIRMVSYLDSLWNRGTRKLARKWPNRLHMSAAVLEGSARAARVLVTVLVSWALLYLVPRLFVPLDQRSGMEAENIRLLGLAERQVTGVLHPFIFNTLETNNNELATKLSRVARYVKSLLCLLRRSLGGRYEGQGMKLAKHGLDYSHNYHNLYITRTRKLLQSWIKPGMLCSLNVLLTSGKCTTTGQVGSLGSENT